MRRPRAYVWACLLVLLIGAPVVDLAYQGLLLLGAGQPVGVSGQSAPIDAPYITQAPNATLTAEQALSALTNGLLRHTGGVIATALAGTDFAAASHTHAESDVASLVSDLAGKAASAHSHLDAEVDNGITLTNLTQVTTRAISDTTGTLAVSRGGTGLTSLGTALQVLRVNAGATALEYGTPSGGGGVTVLRVTADRASTSTTFADVADLTMAVSASTVYTFDCAFSYTSAATTTALQLSINGPASPTAMRYTVETSTTATARHNASQSAYDTVTNAATGGGATAFPVRIAGTLENVNSGTLAIRFRTEVNASAVTIQRGSWCRVS